MIDETNEDPEYWDKILQKEKLGMGRGKRNWLSYRNDIGKTIEAEEARSSGKIIPPGKGPD